MAGKAAADATRLLTVLEAHATPGDAMQDMGAIPSQSSGPLEHTFTLRNDTRAPLTLDHLEPSCPCTTASLVGEAISSAPFVIAPGQTLSVSVSVDPRQLSPGLLHKAVWVFVRGQDAPAATLEMTGALLPAVTFSPPSLSFGRMEKGSELTLLLTVTPSPERLEEGSELRLVSPDPDVQVTQVPQDTLAGALPQATPAVRSFRVRLAPHSHVGRLQGKLPLMLVHQGDPLGTTGPVVDSVAWRAEAEGDVAASPPVVAFGVTTTGQATDRRILLTGKGLGKDPKLLAVSSTNPYLSAFLKPAPKSADARAEPRMELDVHLDARAPAGPLDGRLTVTAPNGEQLILPAFAVVQPNGAVSKP